MSDEGLRGVDPFSELKRSYEDYKVFDAHFENMGKVHDVFVDELDRVRYISIGSGLLNMDFIPIPVEIMRLNDKRQVIEVDATKSQLMHAPTFSDPSELTRENEESLRRHFGITSITPSTAGISPDVTDPTIPREDSRVDLTPGERDETPPTPGRPLAHDELRTGSEDEVSEVEVRRFTR